MKYFVLYENTDMSLLGEGVEFSDGKVVFRWSGVVSSIVYHDSIKNFVSISCNDMKRQIVWSHQGEMNRPYTYFTKDKIIQEYHGGFDSNDYFSVEDWIDFYAYDKFENSTLGKWVAHVKQFSKDNKMILLDSVQDINQIDSYLKSLKN